MDLQDSQKRLPDTPAPNGGGKVWVESVSPGMRTVEAVLRELSQNDVPMLVVAEHGAGKAAGAARIHSLSRRAPEPFRILQGRSSSASDLEACEGQGGTVYLQEAGELAPAAQKEMLRQISLGDAEQNRVPRYICGTFCELEPEVRSGRVLEDLYYRISGVCLRLPPLRQRKEDIPVLRDWFLASFAQDFGQRMPELSAELRNFFVEYHWPGNIRELKDATRAIVALGDEDLAMGGLRSRLRRTEPANGEKISLKDAARAASREAERELILQVLTRTRWNRRRAAQELQISYKALLYKLKQIGYEEYGA
jgi:two-component system, NtrC family, response regulator AtoC